MVVRHWSDDGMVMYHRWSLVTLKETPSNMHTHTHTVFLNNSLSDYIHPYRCTTIPWPLDRHCPSMPQLIVSFKQAPPPHDSHTLTTIWSRHPMMTGIQQETEIIFSAVRPVLLPPRSPSIRFFPLLPSILGKSNHHPASHFISN